MDIDLPWKHDPLRDFPNEREHFMKVWIQELEKLQAKYKIIQGQKEERLSLGYEACLDFINNNTHQ